MINESSPLSKESIDKVAQSIYEFDCSHRGYVIDWEELESRIRSEYLYEAKYTIQAVIEEIGMTKLLDDDHIKHLAETLCKFENTSKTEFHYLSQETQQYYIDLAKVAAETIYGFYSTGDK